MRVSIGDKVLYKEKEYKIIHVYASGFCELRENGTFRTILVHKNEVKLMQQRHQNFHFLSNDVVIE